MKRCTWVDERYPIYVKYHDEEWGIPHYEDQYLFEFLILEGFQAGLSWITVLKKRKAFTFHTLVTLLLTFPLFLMD